MKKPVSTVKKPYSTPELVVYGNLQQITSTVGRTGAMDGGAGMGTNKTRPMRQSRDSEII